jgi:thiamine-phosphate pyrophosphorylase
MKIDTGKLCVITDTVVQTRFSHEELAEMAVKGGADMIQFRDKSMPSGKMVETAKRIKKICDSIKSSKVIFIVNDRVDIALISDADGVHLGTDDIPLKEARELLGKNKIIGGTAHSLNEALKAEKDGADYIGYGHIFATRSKLKTTPPAGLKELADVCRQVNTKIIAVGGITLQNAKQVIDAGAYGIAVIGSVAKAGDPEKIVKQLRNILYA